MENGKSNNKKDGPDEVDLFVVEVKNIMRESRSHTIIRLREIITVIMKNNEIEATTDNLEENFHISLDTFDPAIQRVMFRGENILNVDWVECEIHAMNPDMEDLIKLLKRPDCLPGEIHKSLGFNQ